jgi:hypothetical protein
MELVHNNLFLLFDNTDTIKQIIDYIRTAIQQIANLKSSGTQLKSEYYSIIKNFVEALGDIKSFVDHLQIFNLTTQQKGLIIRNLFAYLFCSHTYISPTIKDTFCEIYPTVFTEVWNIGIFFETKIKSSCIGCCKS